MTTQELLSQQDIDTQFDEVVAHLLEEHGEGHDETDQLPQPDWENKPGERIRSQLETLAVLYAGRSDDFMVDYAGKTAAGVSFATRGHNGAGINEVYTLLQEHSTGDMMPRHTTEECAVDMFSDDGVHHRIHVLPNDEIEITIGDSQNRRVVRNEGEVASILFDYRHRIFNIVEATRNRSPEQRVLDDQDALAKLRVRHYASIKSPTSLE